MKQRKNKDISRNWTGVEPCVAGAHLIGIAEAIGYEAEKCRRSKIE